MFRHVPNTLTSLRLLLAAVFFAMLSYYQHESPGGRHGDVLWLNIALAIYVVAVATDFLDGYLARRWKVESAFGRVVDPFCDKVLVLGSFIFFAGKNFTVPHIDPAAIPTNVRTITGVVPWMVVLILARELLVTSLRGLSESAGQSFAAAFSGKLKMAFQSVTIFVILVYVNYVGFLEDRGGAAANSLPQYATRFRDLCIWATLAITVYSGLLYVRRAVALYQRDEHTAAAPPARAGPADRAATRAGA
jgi:CDP-diacylglycerol---glycerol-3-phosphate 3-phosphatidyltransferase